jgi:plasmid stabilization system protein ParE
MTTDSLGSEMHSCLSSATRLRRLPRRRFVVPRFPYSVAYQVYDTRIVVLAVAHSSRRPLYWLNRTAEGTQAPP